METAMVFNRVALFLCLVLLFVTRAAASAAARVTNSSTRQVRVLRFFRMGLSLSACSYLFRLLVIPSTGLSAVLGFLCCFSGTMLIWVGWMEHWHLHRERLNADPAHGSQEKDDGDAPGAGSAPWAGLPSLNSRARQSVVHAQEEAQRRRQSRVDTDHLLLGLLREPDSAGVDILTRLSVEPESIHLALGSSLVSDLSLSPPVRSGDGGAEPLPLTDRAREALTLAAQEAHRFDKNSVGTDHLLLGLVLKGTGSAAAVLFREGVTVEAIRSEVLKSRVRG